ncbi:MAG TPA: 30S ribosomal protein S4 [Candidatus Paceibacterota bacterium]|nr:30S ribosomal protein S4 [Candidatus Paceibacterota bacterium]
MARYTGPKEKIERRLGERLGIKGERGAGPKAAVVRRPYPPGQHGPSHRPRKVSEFGTQLKAKQKVRAMYRLTEAPLKRIVKDSLALRTSTSPFVTVIRALESRLDNVVFRMGLAQSRDQARQLVSHGHITLNGKRAKTPSIHVRVGDVIGVVERSRALPYFATFAPRWFAKATPPTWLAVDKAAVTATVKAEPVPEESGVQTPDVQSIIEYYSR